MIIAHQVPPAIEALIYYRLYTYTSWQEHTLADVVETLEHIRRELYAIGQKDVSRDLNLQCIITEIP